MNPKPTIDTKPAAGAFAGALVIVALALLDQYTSFHPTVAVAAAITTVVSFAVAWVVPSSWWAKAEAGLAEVDMMASSPETPTVSIPTVLTADPAGVDAQIAAAEDARPSAQETSPAKPAAKKAPAKKAPAAAS